MDRPALILLAIACFLSGSLAGADIRLTDYPYPLPEHTFAFESQQQDLEMVYMDISPADGPPRAVVMLLHGKNFSGAYWARTAETLREAGYRVILPDQIGFGKSSKPEQYHYTFHQLAANTHGLLKELEVDAVHVVGHSMGGMLAVRFALMYPEVAQSLTLVNPIGLEDWKAIGVPYVGVDGWYQNELGQTPEGIRDYMRESYFGGEWKPEYEEGVTFLTQFIESPDYSRMAWNQALTYDMIFTQPVLYEFEHLKLPSLLIIGQRDRTAVGKGAAPEAIVDELGRYPQLGLRTAGKIPDARLIPLRGIGHVPHIEDFDRFMEPLKEFLAEQPDAVTGQDE